MAFSIVKMSERELHVTVFPEENLNRLFFHLKCTKPKQKMYFMHS